MRCAMVYQVVVVPIMVVVIIVRIETLRLTTKDTILVHQPLLLLFLVLQGEETVIVKVIV